MIKLANRLICQAPVFCPAHSYNYQNWHQATKEWSTKLIQSDKEVKSGAVMRVDKQIVWVLCWTAIQRKHNHKTAKLCSCATRCLCSVCHKLLPAEIRLCGLTPWNHSDQFLLTPAHKARPKVHTHVHVMNDSNLTNKHSTLTTENTPCKCIITYDLHSQP